MCNIAGYLGKKQAAPILLEMLRRQAPYDGDMSTGVATIHEGKLYYRKIVGDVDTLIRETDVLDLPGTMGIAHTRPSRSEPEKPFHPFLNMEQTMALVTNGTTPETQYTPRWYQAMQALADAGYTFRHPTESGVAVAEGRVLRIDQFMKQGKTITQALALTCADFYSDNVTVMINENYPDRIFALRTTRPMNVIMENGETYMATCRYGFPEHLQNDPVMLPLFNACIITRDGIQITADRMDMEPVSEMTPYTYAEAYKRIESILKSEKAPLFFDELELALNDMRDLWPGDHTCVQHARLLYDLLWQFDQEGRLQREMRVQPRQGSRRHRWYFSLK